MSNTTKPRHKWTPFIKSGLFTSISKCEKCGLAHRICVIANEPKEHTFYLPGNVKASIKTKCTK